jgi:hypothetical protein
MSGETLSTRTSSATSTSWSRRSADSSSATCSWTSGVWLTTRAMPTGKYSTVPWPPQSTHEFGATVLVISLTSSASFVFGAAGF